MPSLHFIYDFVIGCIFFQYSAVLQRLQGKPTQQSHSTEFGFLAVAIFYPIFVLNVINTTANHYWLDPVVAILTDHLLPLQPDSDIAPSS